MINSGRIDRSGFTGVSPDESVSDPSPEATRTDLADPKFYPNPSIAAQTLRPSRRCNSQLLEVRLPELGGRQDPTDTPRALAASVMCGAGMRTVAVMSTQFHRPSGRR